MQTSIQTIIFDLGGVLLDIDPGRTIEAFRELGMPEFIRPGGWQYGHQVFTDMEQGLISNNQFRSRINKLLPKQVAEETIDRAWCAMLIGFDQAKIEFVRKLKKDYTLYLFSNTNAIHQSFFRELYFRKFQQDLDRLFTRAYYSSDISLRKPSVEAFQFVINDAGINPASALFIDDSEDNIRGAGQTGLQTLWIRKKDDLRSELIRRLNVFQQGQHD